MSEPTLQDCINYMRSQIKQMEKHPRNYEFNLPYYRKTVELLEKAQRPHGEWIFTGRKMHTAVLKSNVHVATLNSWYHLADGKSEKTSVMCAVRI